MSWRTIGASATGISHRRKGVPCQDAFGVIQLDEHAAGDSNSSTIVAVVSDGAGSAEFGGKGAQIGVQCALELIPTLLAEAMPQTLPQWHALMAHILAHAQARLGQEAAAQGHLARDFAATLLIVVAQPTWVVCASIGDCAAVIQDSRGDLHSLCPPQRGEYANATHFYVMPQAAETLVVRLHDFGSSGGTDTQITNLALLTDGLLELALNVANNRPFAPFFQPLFAFAQESLCKENLSQSEHDVAVADLTRFLDSDRINGRTHDDKTLVIVVRELIDALTAFM